MHDSIYTFDTTSATDLPLLSEVGGKALSLISSSNAGLPVPAGFALGVSFFSEWVSQVTATPEWTALMANPSLAGCEAVKARTTAMELGDAQRNALRTAVARLEGNLFAVRSSSPEEDLEGASFAGMYETFLGTTREKLELNILGAFTSMLDWRVVEYKTQKGIGIENPTISVIVQIQVASEVSGVGFSLNPLNNCFDEAVINASFGLGEEIVSGTVTPDEYVVEKVRCEILSKAVNEKMTMLSLNSDGGIKRSVPTAPSTQALTDEQILELATLIGQVEAHYEHPVDIEWAYAMGKLCLLQARPITTYTPLFPEMLTPPGQPKNLYVDIIPLTQGFDEALSVLGADVWSIVLDRLKFGALPAGEDGYIRNIHGRQYFQLHHMMAGLGKRAMVAIKDLDRSLDGREEEVAHYKATKPTKKIKQARWRILGSIRKFFLPGIRAFLNPAAESTNFTRTMDDVRLKFANLSNDRPFDDLVENAFTVFDEVLDSMVIFLPGLFSNWRINRLFKGTEHEALAESVLMDLPSNPTSAMGHAMLALAKFDEIQQTADGEEFRQRIEARDYSSDFLRAWDDYMARYGARGFKEIDVASQRTWERLADFFKQLRAINLDDNQMLSVTSRKEEALATLRAAAVKKGPRKARMFDNAVELINLTYGHRESPKYLVVVMNGNLHRVALEIADEFVAAGRLDHRDQIFDLQLAQVGAAQRDPSLELRPLRDANLTPRSLMNHVKQFPVFIDSRGKVFRKMAVAKDGDLAGQAVANGIVSGRAKVLAEPYEKPLEPGEILVTVATEPAWTPVFVNAAGVVLEIGGGLQHGAIIAREYGIPCVSGLHGVTDIIKDGDLLEVDGTNGIVRILETA